MSKDNDSLLLRAAHDQSMSKRVDHELVEQLVDCIDHLCRICNYIPWQYSYEWFGYQCWLYVFDPTTLPDREKDTLGEDYTLESAQRQVEEMTKLSKAIDGWVVYDQPSGPRYIAMKEWIIMYNTNNKKWKMPGLYPLS